MLILRIEDFQYSFQTIHFNLHPSLLHSSMYLEERRSMGFDWIITLIQEFFFSSWSALCIHYRDSTNDLNYTKCWKKEQLNSLIYCYFSLHSSSLKRTVWSFESTIIFRTTILFIKKKNLLLYNFFPTYHFTRIILKSDDLLNSMFSLKGEQMWAHRPTLAVDIVFCSTIVF